MQLLAWDGSDEVSYDKQLWAELTSLRLTGGAFNVLIMGHGRKKTFRDNALGHMAGAGTAYTPNAPTDCSNGACAVAQAA